MASQAEVVHSCAARAVMSQSVDAKPTSSPATDWHALYTRHQHEKSVASYLEQIGIQVFLPLSREVHRWSDRRKEIVRPLFPCYVFFSGGLERRIQIVNTPGVCSLVVSGGKIAVIPAAELDAIRRAVIGALRVEPHPFVYSGDRIRVHSGPLAGLEGIVARVKDSTRIVLSVQTLCRSIAIEVDETVIERLPLV